MLNIPTLIIINFRWNQCGWHEDHRSS